MQITFYEHKNMEIIYEDEIVFPCKNDTMFMA